MKKAIIVPVLLIIAAFGVFAYSGLFDSVSVSEKEIGPFTMVLKKHTGSYYKTGKIFEEVDASLKKTMDTGNLRAVGIYYDDPAKVKTEDLRSECGFIMERAALGRLDLKKEGLIYKEFKATLCVTSEFPIRTFLSYMIGPSRVYSKIDGYADSKKYKADYGMEIYDMKEKKILYFMPVIGK
jgi:hypothetical protein